MAVSRGQVQSGKEESWEVFFLAEIALRSLKTARGSERGDRLEQVACQVADLALEMTEDALRKASMYLRRCDSDRCATERALRRSRTADSASWDHQALGGTTKAAKGDRGLGSFGLRIGKRSGQPGGW